MHHDLSVEKFDWLRFTSSSLWLDQISHMTCRLDKSIKRKFLVNDHATFLFHSILFQYRPGRKKHDSSKFKIFINEKFWKIFHFLTCILPDYVAHDIANEFWKNSHFQNKTAGFLLRWQNSLRYEISLICHWNIDSLNKIGLLYMLWSQMMNKMSSKAWIS